MSTGSSTCFICQTPANTAGDCALVKLIIAWSGCYEGLFLRGVAVPLTQEPSGAAGAEQSAEEDFFGMWISLSCLELSNDDREEHTVCKKKYKPGTAMENLNVLFPDLTEEQQDIFQRVFTADASYLENHERMNQSFWESLVKCLATTDPPILNTEEKTNLLNSCSVLPGGCAACLEAIEKKGVRAMALLYLLLKATNPSGYRQLPSSKGKDEKLKTLKRLERNLMLSRGEKKAENSSHESMDEDTEGTPADIVPYRDSEIARREDSIADAYEKENTRLHQWTVRWMGIRKDDEFFHFVILCFAIGALLICYYYYKDWTISLGIGLITFASLETTGIYFGLVYRIRSVLNSFVPLIDKFRPPGMRKAA